MSAEANGFSKSTVNLSQERSGLWFQIHTSGNVTQEIVGSAAPSELHRLLLNRN